ncbi:hypothetical protein IGI46_004965 [Enterococcus sp. AZ163]
MFNRKKSYMTFTMQEGISFPQEAIELYEALALIEQENKKLLDSGNQGTVQITLYNKKRQIQLRQVLSLPINNKIEEEIARLIDAAETTNQPQKKQTNFKKNSAASFLSNRGKLFNVLTVINTFAAAAMILLFLFNDTSKPNIQTTSSKSELTIEEVENYQNDRQGIDLLSRFFLPNYYSGNKENIRNFLDNQTFKKSEVTNGQVQSVLAEKLVKKGDKYQVSYVLLVQDDQQKRNVRITYTVKKDKDAKYKYLIITEPKESEYP